MKFKALAFSVLFTLGPLLGMGSANAQTVHFQDNGSYDFQVGTDYDYVIGGVQQDDFLASPIRFSFAAPIPSGTKVTFSVDLSEYSSHPPVNGWVLRYLDSSGNEVVQSYDEVPFADGRTVITKTLTGDVYGVRFGPVTWYNLSFIPGFGASAVTLSNIWFTSEWRNAIRPTAMALRNAFNLQSAKIAQGLSYDCSVFDAKDICVSFAGTRSDGKGGLDDTRGALIVAHKPNANIRFGGYIDQAFNSSESRGLKVKHSSPGYGVFAVWSEKADGSGLQVRGSASFGKADMESTRSEIGSVEPGFGKSDIKSDGFQIEASRDYAVNAMWSARPYVGFRQLTNRRASYTERTEEGIVDFPLSYSSIKQSTQSLLAGVRFAHTISAQTTMTVAAGLEHDIKNDVDRYEASEASIGDIDSIDMEDGKKNTRPTLSLGLTHVIDKAQRIGVSITHRKEAFESGSTTSGMVQYSRGF